MLDEIGTVDAKEAAPAIYALTNGQGKGRAGRDGQARTSLTWRVFTLSTGELPIESKLTERGGKAQAGQLVRLLDIEAEAGFGVFSHLDNLSDGGALSNALKQAAITTYGTAGIAFVEKLFSTGLEIIIKRIEQSMLEFEKHCIPQNADGQVKRAGSRFALIAAAGELAEEFNILTSQKGEITKAVVWAINHWIEQRGGAGAKEDTAIIDCLKSFLEQHGESRFENIETNEVIEKINDRAGYKRGGRHNREWLIFPESWKRIFAGHG